MKITKTLIFLALGMSLVSCDAIKIENSEESSLPVLWKDLPDGSYRYINLEKADDQNYRIWSARCWPEGSGFSCIDIFKIQTPNTTPEMSSSVIAQRVHVQSLESYNDFRQEWKEVARYKCFLSNDGSEMSEAIQLSNDKIKTNQIKSNLLPVLPKWSSSEITKMVKDGGGDAENAYFNCENLRLILQKGALDLFMEGPVSKSDLI